MKLLQYAMTIWQRPNILYYYTRWMLRQIYPGSTKVLCSSSGSCLNKWRTFSEYYSFRSGIPKNELNFLTRIALYAPPDASVFDIGANVGLFTLCIADLFSQCSVFAFEPSSDTLLLLKENLETCHHIKQITIENIAISLCDEEVWFLSDSRSPATNRILSKNPEDIQVFNKSVEIDSVKCMSLDSYCAKACVDLVYFLKIDVEGYEPSVLDGAKFLLENNLLIWIFIEVCPQNLHSCGASIQAFYECYTSMGLLAFRILKSGSLRPLLLSDLLEIDLENIVLCSAKTVYTYQALLFA